MSDRKIVQFGIGILCAAIVFIASPTPILLNPFIWWSVAGSLFLCIVSIWRFGLRSELIELAAWLSLSSILLTIPLFLTVLTSHRTIDASLSLSDHGVSRTMIEWARLHKLWGGFFWVAYDMLPFAMAVVIGLGAQPLRIAKSLLIAGVAAAPLYVAFPATGPAHIGLRYAPRNSVPSLHLTWAVLLVYFTSRKYRPAAALFAVVTAISTLTTGEHYLLDLVAAIPYSGFFIWYFKPHTDSFSGFRSGTPAG